MRLGSYIYTRARLRLASDSLALPDLLLSQRRARLYVSAERFGESSGARAQPRDAISSRILECTAPRRLIIEARQIASGGLLKRESSRSPGAK